jgi:hypothetical protein
MAHEQTDKSAESGTEQDSNTKVWDSFSGEQYPFLDLNEDKKRSGFRVTFRTDKPRKETPNNFDSKDTDFWFDIETPEGEIRTWTFSQKSLVMELQKHSPLAGKTFDIQLLPVDDEFKKKFPKYKGKDRYTVTLVEDKGTKPAESEKKSAVQEQSPEIEFEKIR